MEEEASQPWMAALGIVHQQDDLVQQSDDCYPANFNSYSITQCTVLLPMSIDISEVLKCKH